MLGHVTFIGKGHVKIQGYRKKVLLFMLEKRISAKWKKTNFHWKKVSNSSCVENGRRNDKLKLLVFTLRSFEGFVLQRVFCFPVFS